MPRGERSRSWVKAPPLPVPVHSISPPKRGWSPPDLSRGGEGHRVGSGAAVLLRCIPGTLRRGKQGYPSPWGPWQPLCPPSSPQGHAGEVCCCILSRGAGGTQPAPSSSRTFAHKGSPDLVPRCRSRPQSTVIPPPELNMSQAGWVSCPQPLGLGTHQGLKQHMALARSPASAASPSQLVAAGIEQCSR